jgi:hypothetical protein
MNNLKAFVYFAEYEVIRDMMPGWPPEMRLALGLHVNGECELVVFHRDEANLIIKRMACILKLPVGSFGIVPERYGYPTKAIKFSDQQLLLKLVTEKDDLCEAASDYAINYQFAEEEGFDPLHFTSLVHTGSKPVKIKKPKDSALIVPFASRRIQVKTDRDTTPKEIYYKGHFAELALIEMRGEYIRLTFNPDSASPDSPVIKVTKVGHKNEHSQFILERSLLGEWKTGNTAIIEIPTEKLSGRLSPNYFKHPYVEAVVIVPNGIFVTYNLKIKCVNTTTELLESVSYPFHKNAMRGLTFADNQNTYK